MLRMIPLSRRHGREQGIVQANPNRWESALLRENRQKYPGFTRRSKGSGRQSSGAALVSFNAPAFESYGKEQSYNAPVGRYAEFAYTTALNYLLGQREYTFQLGDSMILFWAEDAKEEYQAAFF